ncbi:MAG: NADP-dependent malic enzyme, partial [Lachnospiraceae bacterium]
MDAKELSLKKHYEWNGKIEVVSRCKVESMEDLAVAYTPGVAQPCLAIADDKELSWKLTRRSNLVAVVTDGSAVLGLGNIGPEAGMPVMEGKCVLFKEFADVDAFPICIDSQDVDTIVDTVALISKSFGGINLEDIAAPRCFEIEEKLKQRCDIPVFHDDQHGTAIVVAAALLNAMKVTGRKMGTAKIVINGAGAAGTAIAKLLLQMNFGSITMCDRYGIVCSGEEWLT